MKNTVYYLPGMGGRLKTGLGQAILDRGFQVIGRETRGEFQKLSFQHKIDTITDDLKTHFWYDGAKVILNSFGAYLFFHSQLQMSAFPGRAIILSPIIGAATNSEIRLGFYPPRADVLVQAALKGEFPCPLNAEIHVGSEDWQSGPSGIVEFANAVGLPVSVVEGHGHMLGVDYVGAILDDNLILPEAI